MAQLAADIVDKCKYIHPSRTEEIEQLLIRLRKHFANAPAPAAVVEDEDPRQRRGPSEPSKAGRSGAGGGNGGVRSRNMDRGGEDDESSNNNNRSGDRTQKPKAVVDNLPPADLNELDDYLEMLYQVSGKSDKEKEQGLRLQERGTAMILKLCRNVMNLEQLIQNSTVMGALTRVLQEEFKKSVELTFNILRYA